jgi:hypothetical protein
MTVFAELEAATHEDVEDVVAYFAEQGLNWASQTEQMRFVEEELERLKIPMPVVNAMCMEAPPGPAQALGLLLLAERQRDRLLIEHMTGDPGLLADHYRREA